MGVDTRLYINNSWSVEDIKDVIGKRFEVPVTLKFHDWSPDYIQMILTLPGTKEARALNIFTKNAIGGLPATLLSLHHDSYSIGFLRVLAETFGGFFQEQDYEEVFEAFSKPGEGNIDFIVKQAIKDEPKLADDDKAMVTYIAEEKWRDNATWHKGSKK